MTYYNNEEQFNTPISINIDSISGKTEAKEETKEEMTYIPATENARKMDGFLDDYQRTLKKLTKITEKAL